MTAVKNKGTAVKKDSGPIAFQAPDRELSHRGFVTGNV
jgi:hypothetical protein